MRPIMRVGFPFPVAYADRFGRIYLVDKTIEAQHMECLVEYDYNFSRDLTEKIFCSWNESQPSDTPQRLKPSGV